jgi:excisionase family DNA binding protein
MTTWLTAEDAARYATVSLWSIRHAVKDGDLPSYSVGKGGRSYRLKAEDIDAWLESTPHEP